MNKAFWFGVAMVASVSAEAGEKPPVEYTDGGMSADKKKVVLKYKINAEHVAQVDVQVRCLDASGKQTSADTYFWKNIVTSKEQPIEKGKSYQDTCDLDPGTVKVETKLQRVFFVDGKKWDAPK